MKKLLIPYLMLLILVLMAVPVFSQTTTTTTADVELTVGNVKSPTVGDILQRNVSLYNPDDLIGGIMFDLCEYDQLGEPEDLMECIDCTMTERTTMFNCAVNELYGGCCRVLLFLKNPGGAINPGIGDIVKVVEEVMEVPESDCVTVSPENIIVSDRLGFPLTADGVPGKTCPFMCGDVCPPDDPSTPELDCGDGVVDIYDIMCLVDLVLTGRIEEYPCQEERIDVPTGTPPNLCSAPNGILEITDIMTLVDMALNRQDCCNYYYNEILF